MIEAQIICCEKCEIPDLGLTMMPGQEAWVSDLVARNSRDLVRAQGMGKVRVYRKARRMNQNPKRPPPPFVAHSRQRPAVPERPQPKVVEKVVETVVEKIEVHREEVDVEKLKAELMGDLLPGLRAVVAEELGKATEAVRQQAAQDGKIDASQLESILESVMRRTMPAGGVAAAGPGDSRKAPTGPEEPLYIPGKIVTEAKGKISVKSTTSEEAADVDEAQAALAALRRKKSAKTDES